MRIAIIGTGISALSTAYYLDKKIDIDIFDINSRLGGHTHTHQLIIADKTIHVDTGFIVCNDKNYLNLLKLFDECNVLINKSDMSFSSTNDDATWSSKDFWNIKYYFSISNIRFLYNIIRFNRLAKKHKDDHSSISEWIRNNKIPNDFANKYIYPMTAAIWSTLTNQIENFPTTSLFRFFRNHGLFDLTQSPQWYSVNNGSSSYLEKMIKKSNISNQYLSKKIKVKRLNGKILLSFEDKIIEYDHLVFSCNTNQIKEILLDPNKNESSAFNFFKYSSNKVVLHEDNSFMPINKNQWTSWNSFSNKDFNYVTYWMNNLQKLETNKNLFVTLGTFNNPKEEYIYKELKYEHIIFDDMTKEGKSKINELQGKDNLFYAGAFLGYGFHEDGIKSGLKISSMINKIYND